MHYLVVCNRRMLDVWYIKKRQIVYYCVRVCNFKSNWVMLMELWEDFFEISILTVSECLKMSMTCAEDACELFISECFNVVKMCDGANYTMELKSLGTYCNMLLQWLYPIYEVLRWSGIYKGIAGACRYQLTPPHHPIECDKYIQIFEHFYSDIHLYRLFWYKYNQTLVHVKLFCTNMSWHLFV